MNFLSYHYYGDEARAYVFKFLSSLWFDYGDEDDHGHGDYEDDEDDLEQHLDSLHDYNHSFLHNDVEEDDLRRWVVGS